VPCKHDAVYPQLTQGYLGAPWFAGRAVFFSADRRFVHFSASDASSDDH